MFLATSSTSKNKEQVAPTELFREAVCIILLHGNGLDSAAMAMILIGLLSGGVWDEVRLLACEKAPGQPCLYTWPTVHSIGKCLTSICLNFYSWEFFRGYVRLFKIIVRLSNPVVWKDPSVGFTECVLLPSLILTAPGFDFSACHFCIFLNIFI